MSCSSFIDAVLSIIYLSLMRIFFEYSFLHMVFFSSSYFNIFVRGFSEITVNFTYLFETAEELIVSLSPRGKHVYCEFTVECAALATRLRKPQCWYLYVFPLG